jgi:hypothetical protein
LSDLGKSVTLSPGIAKRALDSNGFKDSNGFNKIKDLEIENDELKQIIAEMTSDMQKISKK